jgi:hypothetical protein
MARKARRSGNSSPGESSRRDFLKNATTAAAGLVVPMALPAKTPEFLPMIRLGSQRFLAMADVPSAQGPVKVYPERWVYAGVGFGREHQNWDELTDIARTSAEHGLTGIVLSGLDEISIASPNELARLKKFKEFCDQNHLEIIPAGFNTGYGRAVLVHDPNLAEGLLVKGALFVAGKTDARFVPDSPARLVNGGFEEFQGDRVAGFTVEVGPGAKIMADRSVFHSGKVSLRVDNFGNNREGAARFEQEIGVTPNRCYRVSVWVKTENAPPGSVFGIKTYTSDHRDLSPCNLPLPATMDWTKFTTAFNSWYADRIVLNVGVFEAHSSQRDWTNQGVEGKMWIDDLEVEEVGLLNVLRREGTPLRVYGEKDGVVYEEGKDFAPIVDPQLDFAGKKTSPAMNWYISWTHEMPTMQLLPGSRIRPGTRLRLDYYHGTLINKDQVCACPSEPKVWAIWKEQIPLLEKYLAPKKYFLEIDEIRVFNRCEACQRRHMSASAILGDLTTRLFNMIREMNPQAEIFVWSDMYDPNHNAVPKYFLVDGDFSGTWEYLPKDMRIVCWNYNKRRPSLDFFSSHGFRTVAAAYYDADDLKNTEGWLDALDMTPGAMGIMYTTWQHKFKLLAPFGDLVSKRPESTFRH